MPFPSINRATLAAISLLLSFELAQARVAHSGTFQVNPIRITLSRQSSSSLLSVRNDSAEKIRFQIDVFAWDQNPKGEMVLNPTEDLIFYPTLLALEPGDERRIRIGTNDPIVASEKSYRIFVEELPPLENSQSDGIRILTKMGVPIFIQPSKPIVQARLDQIGFHGSEFFFELKNLGNVHFFPRAMRVKGAGSQGETVLERELQSWYILAGRTREYRVEIPRADCEKIQNLTIEVELEDKTLQEKVPLPPQTCRG
jgi:fimbrial chaperone protein